MLGLFGGMQVIQSEYLVANGAPYQVRRSWRERLFTRPWRPFTATRTVTPLIPHPGAVMLDQDTLVMHPATFKQLRDRMTS